MMDRTRIGLYISKLRRRKRRFLLRPHRNFTKIPSVHTNHTVSVCHNEINVLGESMKECLVESPRYHDPPKGVHASHRFHVTISASSSLSEEARIKSWVSAHTYTGHVVDDGGFIGTRKVDFETDSLSENTSRSAWKRNSKANDLPAKVPDGSHAVTEYSSDPHQDFLMSMLAMVESRLENLTVDWIYLEELAICYLDLNDRKCHHYILSAFIDLLTELRRSGVLS